MKNNRICQLFGTQYPLIQAGMVWASGWRLAAAVSEAGGLGVLGAGSMHPETLENHIQKLKAVTNKPFGVNLPLLYPKMELLIDILIREQVPIVFTSAGNPRLWTTFLKDRLYCYSCCQLCYFCPECNRSRCGRDSCWWI